mmetsp:Transcript_34871/g.87735  ORF Transcript_34871/g.87735 Transcript_34871/m.87735 type:complete len:207 (-) Transcript_34871:1983-2603(-)
MLLVAFSRRMCCSRVCSAMRSAGLPDESFEMPMMRPGMRRVNFSSATARKAAWGPPKPMGTPNLCEFPSTMSKPNSPGARSSTHASRSVTHADRPPFSCTSLICLVKSRTWPSRPGYANRAPHSLEFGKSNVSGSPTCTLCCGNGSARDSTTAMVCGEQFWSMKNSEERLVARLRHMECVSAAAVASSSKEAFAMRMPVRSVTMVW